MANRYSAYSNLSTGQLGSRGVGKQASQVSTTTLLNNLHSVYSSEQPHELDASTSLVVNTWLTAASPGPEGQDGGTVDSELAKRAWEHARRRAEDGCIVLCSTHESGPSLLSPFIASLPLTTPQTIFAALAAIRPFVSRVTPVNPTSPRYSALAVNYTFTLTGQVSGMSLSLSTSGLDTSDGLLDLSSEAGNRAFDVFYYLLTSASTPAEREFLGLKDASAYNLLNRSNTFAPPSYLPTADDTASAEDFRSNLKAIGIKGATQRDLITVLAALLKLGNAAGFLVDEDELEDICEDVGGLLNLDPEVLLRKCSTDERAVVIDGIYGALVDWVIDRANAAIAAGIPGNPDNRSSTGSDPEQPLSTDDTVGITVIDIPSPKLGRAVALRGVFDDTLGINAEMREDGLEFVPAGHSVLREMQNVVNAVDADLGVTTSPAARERERHRDRTEGVLEKIGVELEQDCFLQQVLYPKPEEGVNVGKLGRFDLASTLGSSRVWYHINIHPTDDPPETLTSLPSVTSAWSAGSVSRQLREWRLPEWANRRNKHLDFTADFDVDEFVTRYAPLGCQEGKDGVENFLLERGWSNGEVIVGHERIWVREVVWWEAESMLDLKPSAGLPAIDPFAGHPSAPLDPGYVSALDPAASQAQLFPPQDALSIHGSRDNLGRQSMIAPSTFGGARSLAPSQLQTAGDYGLGSKGDEVNKYNDQYENIGKYAGELDPEFGDPSKIEERPISLGRRLWVAFVWALTFWIPSPALRYIGRMKRPDVRMAWREKLVLVFLILLTNVFVIFYIVEFGNLLCPNKNKVWDPTEVKWHAPPSKEFWVSIRGTIYDISSFWKENHSDQPGNPSSESRMKPLGGLNLDGYFPVPMDQACKGFGVKSDYQLQHNNTEATLYAYAEHKSGPQFQSDKSSKLYQKDWYSNTFVPAIKQYYKGQLVHSKKDIEKEANDSQRYWVIIKKKVYDLTDYFYTVKQNPTENSYDFLPSEVTQLFKKHMGQDITSQWKFDDPTYENSLTCLNNAFYVGGVDFRNSPRCQVNNYILLAFTCLVFLVILVKFLAALQFGGKRYPSRQEKFVICQVPVYTEGEDQIRKGLDSLTALDYDNKRKLLCVICDGMIVGAGNDRPTPKIVLDILGVDPKIDPPALPFKSVGTSSEQLNYGKVYSGLYEFEGNVVPYVVLVKVGKESEQTRSKPGNRGKRDSQLLLMSFLNRVHHRAPMSPLELELFHQINNIIGVDPELYEYLFMVDADTTIQTDSLNRLVAACASDSKIAGICGETSLENEQQSWWTMIQVYEYYISHNLSKAFESLFGGVTCLPGCFSMYRLRTFDKGRPLIINESVIKAYSDINVDTLHRKNLFSLGEDRYLTTLMTRTFPSMSFKYISDAHAWTSAPETWGILLSQRRRWINSTIHNLFELAFLDNLCGFCCFGMRFVVFVDLFGTVILPATCVYLVYMIYMAASHKSAIPYISIAMLAAVYGLQALIFLFKRQWQHIGWMFIYILAYPIYSIILPIYSFWNQDNFSWGNTRVVIGEKGNKQIVAVEDEVFDPRSIPLQRWDDYAAEHNLPGRRGNPTDSQEKFFQYTDDVGLEMDDMHSTYSSVKPASTILTGFPGHNTATGPYLVPHTPSPLGHSRMSTVSRLPDIGGYNQSRGSLPLTSYHDNPAHLSRMSGLNTMGHDSQLNVRQSSFTGLSPRPQSSVVDFRNGPNVNGPDEATIAEAVRMCLADVDLDNVTKKQVRALVEQRLQTTLSGEKKMLLDRQIDTELANM